MIAKIKSWLELKRKKEEVAKKLEKSTQYFQALKNGQLLIKFIQTDIAQMKEKKMNRDQRRRFEKELYFKGEFSPELIQYYEQRLDNILAYLETEKKRVRKINTKPTVQEQPKNV
jgi:hypothetical protein